MSKKNLNNYLNNLTTTKKWVLPLGFEHSNPSHYVRISDWNMYRIIRIFQYSNSGILE